MPRQPLPIDQYLPTIIEKFRSSSNLILEASPGSGKTTRVPPALLSTLPAPQQLWVLTPRRIAAKAAAMRVAEEMGEDLGKTVGYHFRLEKKTSSQTRLLFLTEGLFFRLLSSNPNLENVGAVLLDEFHERHLHTDLSLNYLRLLQKKRKDFKTVIMSATLQSAPLLSFLNADSLKVDEKPHPLDIVFIQNSQERLESQIRKIIQSHLEKPGDILVFLPGQLEIFKCEQELVKYFSFDEYLILPLYGDLSFEKQEIIFQKTKKRKIILSTNIAESSLTIPGVRMVIDSGLHRELTFSPEAGIPNLHTRRIPQASAIQRAGRAAREAKGFCIRLYSEHDFLSRPLQSKPEILRTDLSQSLLELLNLSIDFKEWEWFESPTSIQLQTASKLLFNLGATQSEEWPTSLTSLGKKMAELPLHPRISRILLSCSNDEELRACALLGAYLNEGEISSLDAQESLRNKPPYSVQKTYEQILRLFSKNTFFPQSTPASLGKLFLAGFPDRVAKKRGFDPRSQVELILCQEGCVYSKPDLFLKDSEYFIVLEAQNLGEQGSAKNKNILRAALKIEEEDLLSQARWIHEEKNFVWSSQRKTVLEKDKILYGKIILEENERSPQDLLLARDFFIKEGLRIPPQFWTTTPDLSVFLQYWAGFEEMDQIEETLTRLVLWRPEISFRETIFKALEGVYAKSHLEEISFSQRILQTFSWKEQEELNQTLPLYFILAGRKCKIHYRLHQNPWLSSKLQDFFGLKETPTILNGKIKLTLHLLAPNKRPVQVTQDLKSFWQNTYPKLRPQLSGRYPKHRWP